MLEDQIRKKVKTEAPPSFLGLDLDEANTLRLHVVANALIDYRRSCQFLTEHQVRSLAAVSQEALLVVPEVAIREGRMAQCFELNQFFLRQLVEMRQVGRQVEGGCFEFGMDKVCTLLLQVAREWSAECAAQRNYINTVRELLRKHMPNCQSVLVPGFQTGRLLAELLLDGLTVRGHEECLANFLAASFFLNRCIGRIEICPYSHSFCNHLESEGPYRKLLVPDLIPQNVVESEGLTASVGDFVRLYRFHAASWDCVISCFSLEDAKNAILMVRLFYQLLHPGGLWINYGTLNYRSGQFELTHEQLMAVVRHEKFSVLESGTEVNRHFHNSELMLNTENRCSWFVARK